MQHSPWLPRVQLFSSSAVLREGKCMIDTKLWLVVERWCWRRRNMFSHLVWEENWRIHLTCTGYPLFNWVLLCYSFLEVTQKSKVSPPESTDNESVSGRFSPLSSGSELSKLEQGFTAGSLEPSPQVSLLHCTLVLDTNASEKLAGKWRSSRAGQEQEFLFKTSGLCYLPQALTLTDKTLQRWFTWQNNGFWWENEQWAHSRWSISCCWEMWQQTVIVILPFYFQF